MDWRIWTILAGILAVLAAGGPAHPASAAAGTGHPPGWGVLRTLDGQVHEGVIRLADGHLQWLDGRVLVRDLLDVRFADSGPMSRPRRGVVLTDGSILAMESVQEVDALRIAIRHRTLGIRTVRLERVSRIVFEELDDWEEFGRPGRTGVLLSSGDFFEGEFAGLEDGRIRIRSVLFGTRSFEIEREVSAVALRGLEAREAPYEVRLRDGSILRVGRIFPAEGRVSVDHWLLDEVRVLESALAEIRYRGRDVEQVVDIEPARVRWDRGPGDAGGAGDAGGPDVRGAVTIDGTGIGLPMRLLGMEVDAESADEGAPSARRGMGIRDGARVDFALDGRYRSFVAVAGVPADVLPLAEARVRVLADGVVVHGSEGLTSLSDPAWIGVDVRGARTLTLEVEGAATIWLEPLLIRAGSAE